MSIWNKVLAFLVFFAALAFFYMAGRTLKTREYWCKKANELETALARTTKENTELLEAEKAEDGKLGIIPARRQLNLLLLGRGRVWYNCDPGQKMQTGKVAVTTDAPVPNGISDKMILYVVEEKEVQKGGQYLGEFRVNGVAEKKVGLEPTMKLNDRELTRLMASHGPWTLYENMPLDRHDYFAGLSEAEKKSLLAGADKEVLTEYLRDGQPAGPNDPKDCIGPDHKYVRKLHDYKNLFKNYHLARSLYVDLFETITRDQQYLEDADKEAQDQLQFAQKGAGELKVQYAQAAKEAREVAKHQSRLQQRVADFQAAIEKMIAENMDIARQIAKLQLDAARRIDQRARAMAQAGQGTR